MIAPNPFQEPRAAVVPLESRGDWPSLLRVLAIVLLLGAFDSAVDMEMYRSLGPEELGMIFAWANGVSIGGAIAGIVLAYFFGSRAIAIAGCVLAAIGCAMMFAPDLGAGAPRYVRALGSGLTSVTIPVLLGRGRFGSPNQRDAAFMGFNVAREVSSLLSSGGLLAFVTIAGPLVVRAIAAIASGGAAVLALGLASTRDERMENRPNAPIAVSMLAAFALSFALWLSKRAMTVDQRSGRVEWIVFGAAASIVLGGILAWRYVVSGPRELVWKKIALGALLTSLVAFGAATLASVGVHDGAAAVFALERAAGVVALPILTAIAATQATERRSLIAVSLVGFAVNAGSAISNVIFEPVLTPMLYGAAMVSLALGGWLWRRPVSDVSL